MAEVINLRTVRKQAKRQKRDQTAQANRLAFGQPKHLRKLEAAQQPRPAVTSTGAGLKKGTADEISGCQTFDRYCGTQNERQSRRRVLEGTEGNRYR